MDGPEENRKEGIHAVGYVTFRKKEGVAGRKAEKSKFANVFVTPEGATELLRLSYAARSPAKPSLSPVKKNIVRNHAGAFLLSSLGRKCIILRNLMRWK